MARRKQTKPNRSDGRAMVEGEGHEDSEEDESGLVHLRALIGRPVGEDVAHKGTKRPRTVEDAEAPPGRKIVRKSGLFEPEGKELPWQTMVVHGLCGKEVAEIHLLNTSAAHEQFQSKQVMLNATTTIRIQWRSEGKAHVWSVPEVSKNDLSVQVVIYPAEFSVNDAVSGFNSTSDSNLSTSDEGKVLISGEVDGSNAAISALVYLIQQQYVSLKPAPCSTCGTSLCTTHRTASRLRVIISDKAFSTSALTVRKTLWKMAMQKMMSWLRPEIHSLMKRSSEEAIAETRARLSEKKQPFNPAALYDAMKPSRIEKCPDMSFPQLLPELRPYQRRAATWMVQREKGNGKMISSSECEGGPSTSKSAKWNADAHPLWLVVTPLDDSSDFYYNPLSGAVSLEPDDFVSYVRGGILADEMGLGKTVELLACILAHRNDDLPSPGPSERARKDLEDTFLRRKVNRYECVCGSVDEKDNEHDWMKCGICDAWQHSTCVAYAKAAEHSAGQSDKKSISPKICGGAVSKRKRVGVPPISYKDTKSNRGRILSSEYNFFCAACIETIAKVEVDGISGSTLVVCPTPILRQWQEEILRHTKPGSLRVLVYEGVGRGARLLRSPLCTGKEESSRLRMVSAQDLAAADIVLTTYDTLKSDLFHDPDKTKVVQRSMRYFKRYPVIPTPLTRFKWWRICLDEAQMVESSTAKATEMALLLEAENRWCVSGTPIQRGLDDIFGLLKFLQAKPFDDFQHWSQLLQQPYEAGDQWAIAYMHKFLEMIMWRSSKSDVKDELNLPNQAEDVTWLRFSPIDAYFYQQQHEKCALKARDVINKYGKQLERDEILSNHTSSLLESLRDADTPLPQAESTLLSSSLLQLRQACCHPQVGSSGIGSLQQRKPMTMKNILQKLLDQARGTAEESQRNLIAAWNGLAALAIIDNDIPTAESIYTEALTLIEKNAAEVNVDPLQRLHTLHNLADILKAPDPTHANTLRLDLLVSQCNEIRAKYMGAFLIKNEAEKAKFHQTHEQVAEAEKACESSGGRNWWLEVLSMTERRSEKGEELVDKIKSHFLENAGSKRGRVENASSLTHRFRSIAGLKLVLQNELDAIQEKRRRVIAKLKELEKMMDRLTVEDAARHAYCKNHSEENGDECDHCKMEHLFQEYENRLLLLRTSAGKADELVSIEEAIFAQQRLAAQRRTFGPRDGVFNEDEDVYGSSGRRVRESNATQAQVIGAPSETEVILSLIKTHAGLTGPNQRDAARKHLQIFEASKKEYWQMRKWVTAQKHILLTFDELNMATLRHRLQVVGEKRETVVEKMVKLHREELPAKRMQLELDRDEAKQKLLLAEGSLRYLQGLSVRREEEAQSNQSGCFGQKTTEKGAHDLDEETCKICYGKFGSERMILRCGHFFCNTCCMRLITMAYIPTDAKEKCIFCPTCRQSTDVNDITLVNDGSDKYTVVSDKGQPSDDIRDREEADFKVAGDYGTKIGAIVRRMLWLKSKDPQAKVLVFSTWQDLLDVVGHALTDNNIRFVCVKGSKFDKALEEFRTAGDEHVQALLLPFKKGGNGLNLVEAQHVVLVEPVPNPGIEAQAINRIHRIGQHRATFVHRFIVKDTVEERIFELGRQKAKLENLTPSRDTSQNILTLSDVSALFAPDIIAEEKSEPQEDPEALDNYRIISPTAAAGAAAEARRIAGLPAYQVMRA